MEILRRTLNLIPDNQPTALLLRHSIRHPIIDWENSDEAGLTEEGVELAEELGRFIAGRHRVGRVVSSPVERCIDTAAAILRGADWPVTVIIDQRLSHPFIQRAWRELADSLYSPRVPAEVWEIIGLMMMGNSPPGHLDLFITHDTVVGAVIGYLLDEIFDERNWPGFLEGFAIWRNPEGVYIAWRDKVHEVGERLDRKQT